jgi:hypothetical protein
MDSTNPAAGSSISGAKSSVEPGTASPRSSSRRPRTAALLALSAIVVVAIVLLALFVTGIIPGLRTASTKSPANSMLAYSAARSLADSAAATSADGPWRNVGAQAIDDWAGASFALGLSSIFGCGLPGNSIQFLTTDRPTVPAFNGSFSSGLAPWWVFDYTNGTTSVEGNANLLAVVVVNGTAIPLATGSCFGVPGVPPVTPPGPAMDSPAALALAVATNTSYVEGNSALNASFSPVFYSIPGMEGWYWDVVFTTCAPFEQFGGAGYSTYNGTEYGVSINATSGATPGQGLVEAVSCSSLG